MQLATAQWDECPDRDRIGVPHAAVWLNYVHHTCTVTYCIPNTREETVNQIIYIFYTNRTLQITSELNNIIITVISARRYPTICYILCCRNSISCSHIGYISCGCNLCSISAISIICVHLKVFKFSLVRSRCVQLCWTCETVCVRYMGKLNCNFMIFVD